MTPRPRAIPRHLLRLLVVGIAFLFVAAPAGASDVRVEGTTDTTDSGLIQDVIQPGFEAAFPQYTLKYHATGTGAALTNARAGQADAVLTHAPSSEAQFVSDGFSLEPFGRATFFNDYILIGHNADPASVAGNDPHDAVSAMEAIAAAAGNATWISRGDNSGTHVQEGVMWCMTSGVPVHSLGSGRCEPDDGSGGIPSWYKKTGVGQAQSVQVTAECNFPPASADSCYSMTDRGTYDNLQSQGAISGMKIVAEKNTPNARGGENLLINPFHVYAVNPNNPAFAGKGINFNTDGALAFMDYLTSPDLQQRLLSYPSTANPRFIPDATPQVQVNSVPDSIGAGDSVNVNAKLINKLPGAGPVQGAATLLQFAGGINNSVFGPLDPTFGDVASATTDGAGNVALSAKPERSGTLRLSIPRFQDLTATTVDVGSTRVRASVDLQSASVTPTGVRLQGRLAPTGGRRSATLNVVGQASGITPTTVQSLNLPDSSDSFDTTVPLGAGTWTLKMVYSDPTAVEGAESRSVEVIVPAALVPPAAITPASLTRASIRLGLRRRAARLTLTGALNPAVTGNGASVQVLERKLSSTGAKGAAKAKRAPRFKRVATKTLRNGASKYSVSITLGRGRWQLKTRYRNPGVVRTADSRARSVSVR
jgi:tungstate transport system substrate-binding protein